MKAYDEDAKYILFINKSIIILGCSTVNSLTIGFWDIFPNMMMITGSVSCKGPFMDLSKHLGAGILVSMM